MVSFAIFPHISVPSLEILALDTIEEGPAAFIPILPLDLSSFGAQEVNPPSHQIEGVFGTLVISPTAAAEPNSLSLLLSGMLGLGFLLGMTEQTQKNTSPPFFDVAIL